MKLGGMSIGFVMPTLYPHRLCMSHNLDTNLEAELLRDAS